MVGGMECAVVGESFESVVLSERVDEAVSEVESVEHEEWEA